MGNKKSPVRRRGSQLERAIPGGLTAKAESNPIMNRYCQKVKERMESNWDKDGNWVGDNMPDSTTDWGVKPVDSAHPIECAGFIIGMAAKLAIWAIPIALVVWFVIEVMGVK